MNFKSTSSRGNALALLMIIIPLTLPWLRYQETAAFDSVIDGIGTTLAAGFSLAAPCVELFISIIASLPTTTCITWHISEWRSADTEKLKHGHSQDSQIKLPWRRLAELSLCLKYIELEGSMSFFGYLRLFHPFYFSKLTTPNGSDGWLEIFSDGTSLVSDHYRSGHYRNTSTGRVYVRFHSVRCYTHRY